MTGTALTAEEAVEDAFVYIPGPSVEIEERPDLVLRNQPHPHSMYGMVLRPRLRDVEASLALTREWFAARDRKSYSWLVGDHAEPADLSEQLLRHGATPNDDDPLFAGMILEREPAPATGVEVRRVESFEDYVAANEAGWRSFLFTDEQRAELRPKLRERYEEVRVLEGSERFVAVVDGSVVGSATSAYLPCGTFLLAGNVVPEARGRGVYRALVRARWDASVARGTPRLLVQAGEMSKPILARLGFETVCTIEVFCDGTSLGDQA
jgi:GNAT superfamily N-acetyltransferase